MEIIYLLAGAAFFLVFLFAGLRFGSFAGRIIICLFSALPDTSSRRGLACANQHKP